MHADALRRTPVFARVPQSDLDAVAPLFERRVVAAASPVWFEEQHADEMAVVVAGELSVRVGVQEVGAVRAGELVGETSTFFGDNRVATVVAAAPTELLVIARAALLDLRAGHPEVYDRLLDRALEAMARRVQDAGRRIALLGNGGVEPPARKAPSALARLLRVGAEPETDTPPGVLPVLRGLPVLREAGPAVLNRVASALKPRRIRADEVLFLEGEPGDSAFILVEGKAEVIRAVRGGRARKLAAIGAGSVVGTGSLLLGERRNASVRVTEAGWARELDRAAHEALTGDAGRAWRESLLAALRFQVQQADANLAQLKGGTSYAERQRLRLAAQRLSSWSGRDPIQDPWTWRGVGAP